MDSIDILLSILRERAVSHHSVLGTLVLIIHRDDHRMVVLDAFTELEGSQVICIKLNLALLDMLV